MDDDVWWKPSKRVTIFLAIIIGILGIIGLNILALSAPIT